MKKLMAMFGLLVLMITGAHAADLRSMKDLDNRDRAFLSPSETVSQNWSSIWVAALAGYSMSDTYMSLDLFGKGEEGTERLNLAKIDGFAGEGFDATLQVGFDRQIGRVVIGGWGEYSFGGIESSASVLNGLARLKVEQKDTYGAFVRAGVPFGDTLFYGAGGYVWTSAETTLTLGNERAGHSFDFSGPVAELGVEHRFGPNVRGKLSARYTWLDEENLFSFGDEDFGGRLTAEPGIFSVKAGIVITTN